MTTLYELAGTYRALSDKLHDLNLPEEVIADTLESEAGDLIEKGTNVAKVFRNLEALANQIKEAEAQMAARRKAIENRAESLKTYLKTNMEECGIQKIESPWFVISIKQNPEALQVDNVESIPRKYFKKVPVSYFLDKSLCKQAIKDGAKIKGCHLSRSTRLEVK
jgi:hypothetical protein